MNRKIKFEVGGYYHIYIRGNNRQKIFLDERDQLRYLLLTYTGNTIGTIHLSNHDTSNLGLLFKLDRREPLVAIGAYCLMPNHFHFIVHQITQSAISGFMRGVCDGYAKAINKERSRSGHLFEGKYKMKQIVNDTYLVHLSRYIHLNPVRAGLVRLPQNWGHSSCQAYYGMREDPMVSTQAVLEQFGSTKDYKKFVEEYVAEDRRRISNLLI